MRYAPCCPAAFKVTAHLHTDRHTTIAYTALA